MKRKAQSGFTLIEALIAILVFSVGLIGMAGLMLVSVRTNHSAYLRTQATFLAESLADRVRSNRSRIADYSTTYDAGTVGADPCTGGLVCVPETLAARDIAVWSQQLVQFLPNPTAVLNCDGNLIGSAAQAAIAPFNGLCTLTIEWDEASLQRGTEADPASSAPNIQTFAWVFQP